MINIVETNFEYKPMEKRNKTNRIILHHAAISKCTPEQIHRWHLNNGWCGAGYHFLVKKDGSIYRLRPEDKVGAHAYGSNYDSIGICTEGNFEEEQMPEEQYVSICELIINLLNKYNINVLQKHNDVNNTACPGKNFLFERIVRKCFENVNFNNKITTGKIANIQKQINEKYNLNITVDNIYGNETKGALVLGLQRELNIQFNANLKEDGIFGPRTNSACINVAKGAKGNITYLIQAIIICHNIEIDTDSIFGPETQKAVMQIQRRNDITIDGIVGKNTFRVLFR